MTTNLKNVLIWLPLPPHAGWRGEGIAQTIENILVNFSGRLQVKLLVSNSHYENVRDVFRDHPNIEVRALTFKGLIFNSKEVNSIRRKSEQSDVLLIGKAALGKNSRLQRWIKLFSSFIANVKYATTLMSYTWLQRWDLIFRNVDIVWIPTPAIAFSDKLSGKRVVSFWDPFVFEYREFDSVAPFLLVKFLELFKDVRQIITQSEANRSFLIRVMQVNASLVEVINNGAPDYSCYISGELKDKRRKFDGAVPQKFRKEVLQMWLGNSFCKPDRMKFFEQFINESIIYRLAMRVREESKILMVSTQSRPYKGMDAMLEIFDGLLKKDPENDFLFIMTSTVPESLRRKYSWFVDRVFEVTRVPNNLHAHLYLISDIAVHPSFAEGGLGAYPQYEAASLGIPAIINNGRHAYELVTQFPDIRGLVSDFNNTVETIELIEGVLWDADIRKKNIDATQSSRLSWVNAAQRYEENFLAL